MIALLMGPETRGKVLISDLTLADAAAGDDLMRALTRKGRSSDGRRFICAR